MLTLFYHPLCPFSRYVRLILGEYGIEVRLVEERFWERREEFLLLNPAGQIPVLVADGNIPARRGRPRTMRPGPKARVQTDGSGRQSFDPTSSGNAAQTARVCRTGE